MRVFIYSAILAAITIIAILIGLDQDQVAAIVVFSGLISGTLLFWKFRLAFALAGIGSLIALGLLSTGRLIEFAGLDLILFLVGMMTVIGYLEEKRFFEHILEKLIKGVGINPMRLTVLLMLLAGMFAALVDEVTSILFMAGTVIHLTTRLNVNPVPFVIIIIFATNIGSSATVVGNPIGVLIALRGDLSFIDFLRWATPISIAGLAVAIPISLKYFSKSIKEMGRAMSAKTEGSKEVPDELVFDKKESFKLPWIVFLGTIAGLVIHSPVEVLLGLDKNSMLLGTALIAAGVVLFLNHNQARELVQRRVDWWTLSFFIFLFASVGTLEFTGVTSLMANNLIEVGGGDEARTFFIFTIVAGLLSATMDNVLGVALLIPVVNGMSELDISTYPLWWSLLFGGTFFGNLTPIGSTANIVAIGMMEKRNLGNIKLFQWIKPGAAVSVPTLLVAMMLLYLQIPLMPE